MNIDNILTHRIQALRSRFEKQAARPVSRGERTAMGQGLRILPSQGSKFVSPSDVLQNIYGSNWPDIRSRTAKYRQQNPSLSRKYFLGNLNPTNLAGPLPIENRLFWGSNHMVYSPIEEKVVPPAILTPKEKWTNRKGTYGNALKERLLWGEETGHERQAISRVEKREPWEQIPTFSESQGKVQDRLWDYPYPSFPDQYRRRVGENPSDVGRGIRHMWDPSEFTRKVAQIRQLYHMLIPDAQPIETPEDFRKAWEDVYEEVQSKPGLKIGLSGDYFPLFHIDPESLPEETLNEILRLGPGVVEAPESRQPKHAALDSALSNRISGIERGST